MINRSQCAECKEKDDEDDMISPEEMSEDQLRQLREQEREQERETETETDKTSREKRQILV